MGLLMRKNHLLRCRVWLSLLNWIMALTLNLLLKLPPRKLESWFILWSFFPLRFLCISINIPYNCVYCSHVWTGTPSCYLELRDKLQKQIWTTVGPSLATSLGPLTHCRNVSWNTGLSKYCIVEILGWYPAGPVLPHGEKVPQAFQWIFCVLALNRQCKEVFSKTAWAIYCLPLGFKVGCKIFVIS